MKEAVELKRRGKILRCIKIGQNIVLKHRLTYRILAIPRLKVFLTKLGLFHRFML